MSPKEGSDSTQFQQDSPAERGKIRKQTANKINAVRPNDEDRFFGNSTTFLGSAVGRAKRCAVEAEPALGDRKTGFIRQS